MGLISKLSVFLLFLSSACFAQLPFSIGVKAGVPITDSFNSTQLAPSIFGGTNSKNYIIGPMVELKLPFRLSVEADALYRPLTVTTSTSSSIPSGASLNQFFPSPGSSSNYSSWQFPILAKYHFHVPLVTPYLEAGPSFRAKASNISYLSDKGITLGAGADVHALILRISPEFRYTRWGSDSGVSGFIPVQSKQNQVEFLVGFSF